MTNPHKPPTAAHKASWIALAIAVVGLLTQIIGVWNPAPSKHQVAVAAAPVAAQQAKATVRTALTAAASVEANTAPPANQACNVPIGQGVMGACAPRDTASAGKLFRSLNSAPARITGHPIGADVSSYQGCQSHFQLAFVITKATESTGYTDRCLTGNVAAAKHSGVPYSAYDFLRPGSSSATAEAAHYVAAVKAAGGNTSLPPVADVEATRLSPAGTHAYVCQWVRNVKQGLNRPVVIIYTGNWFWGPKVGGDDCGATILWVSAYASYAQIPGSWGGGILSPNSRYNPRAPLWQYSDGVYGPYPRIDRWDTDVYFGTETQLRALAGATVKPCSQRTACRMGRRHAHVHRTILRKCHGAPAASHRRVCRKLRSRNSYMHRYARRHHLVLVTR